MSNTIYGSLLNRIKAALIDSLIIVGLGLAASSIFDKFENLPDWSRLLAFLFVFLLYDPLFTSLFGATIGHFIIGLRVRKSNDESKKILFPVAVLRFILKAFLGAVSLLTVSDAKKKKAIHDIVASSVVIQEE